jgi:hypothetical protein
MVTEYIVNMEQIQEHLILLALERLLKLTRILMEHPTEGTSAIIRPQKP